MLRLHARVNFICSVIQLREHTTPTESKQLRVISRQIRRAILPGDGGNLNHQNVDMSLPAGGSSSLEL